MGFSPEDMELLSTFEMTAEQFCQDMSSESDDLPPGAGVTIETRDDGTWCIITAPFASLDELRTFYDGDGITINRLELIDNTFYYDLSTDMGTSEDFSSFSEMGVDFKILWTLTVPGNLDTHNASSVSGNTLTWDLTNSSGPAAIQAQSSLGGGGLNIGFDFDFGGVGTILSILLCCLCLLVLVGGGAAAFFFLRKRNQEQTNPSTTDL